MRRYHLNYRGRSRISQICFFLCAFELGRLLQLSIIFCCTALFDSEHIFSRYHSHCRGTLEKHANMLSGSDRIIAGFWDREIGRISTELKTVEQSKRDLPAQICFFSSIMGFQRLFINGHMSAYKQQSLTKLDSFESCLISDINIRLLFRLHKDGNVNAPPVVPRRDSVDKQPERASSSLDSLLPIKQQANGRASVI